VLVPEGQLMLFSKHVHKTFEKLLLFGDNPSFHKKLQNQNELGHFD